MGYRHPNPRLVKVHRNYSVEEIARLFGIHKNTYTAERFVAGEYKGVGDIFDTDIAAAVAIAEQK